MNCKTLIPVVLILFLSSCHIKTRPNDNIGDRNRNVATEYSSKLRISLQESGWTAVDIINPWDTAQYLQRLALVPDKYDINEFDIHCDRTVVRIPVKNTIVTSTVHLGLFDELGVLSQIKGITDANYATANAIKLLLEAGEIKDCGTWMAPDTEKILRLNPDAIILSPYQNLGSYSNILEMGLPVIFAADYTEENPLGRAEWIKFYGMLYGKGDLADSIFSVTEKEYSMLQSIADSIITKRPRKLILLDLPYNGSWYVSGKGALNDILITDAGGTNPFATTSEKEITPIAMELALVRGMQADKWLIRYHSSIPLDRETLLSDYPFIKHFKSFHDTEIWACNTGLINYFEETPFHPERLLREYISIFHDTLLLPSDTLKYFKKIH